MQWILASEGRLLGYQAKARLSVRALMVLLQATGSAGSLAEKGLAENGYRALSLASVSAGVLPLPGLL